MALRRGKSTFCSLSWTSNFDWHTDCRTHPQHPVIAPLPGCMEHNQSWWWCRFGSSEWANENPLCHLIKLEETLRALVFNFSWPGLSLRVVYVRKKSGLHEWKSNAWSRKTHFLPHILKISLKHLCCFIFLRFFMLKQRKNAAWF